MTEKLRKAAEQALADMMSFEAGTGGLFCGEFAESITALRAALAYERLSSVIAIPITEHFILPWYKLVPVEPTREMSDAGGSAVRVCYSKQYGDRREREMMCDYIYRKMLNAAPEAPKPERLAPLTDDEIDAISDDHRDWTHQIGAFRRFARAIEAAHGITGGGDCGNQ